MNWWRKELISAAVVLVLFLPLCSTAAVFVYEVETLWTTFNTASKLPPDAFLMYNGGEDIIRRLKVIEIYADKDFELALRNYGLENKNLRFLPHKPESDNNTIPRRPYYWWR